MIIQSLQKITKSKKCGPKMVCAFVELLGQFASVSFQYRFINFTIF